MSKASRTLVRLPGVFPRVWLQIEGTLGTMAIDERRRLELADAAKRTFGDDAGVTLMELLPPVGWADIATKSDLRHLERRFDGLELRFDGLESRFDRKLEALEARMDLKLETL